MSINLYSSNRLEILADQCAQIFRQNPLPPMEKEIIVVQSRGMSRWLAMRFARRLSVWANGDFPFPNKFVGDLFTQLVPDSDLVLYERQKAVWQIMELFEQCAHEPLFSRLETYLADPLRRFQLAGQLANLFDQYIIFRPDLIKTWEKGDDKSWQAEIWRKLITRYDLRHRAALFEELLHVLKKKKPGISLPSRITLFGISSLPPFHLEIFNALARHVPVSLFFMNPSRHWWGDIQSERHISRLLVDEEKEAAALYLESGNPLLASMGHLAGDFLTLLQNMGCMEYDLYEEPAESTMLAALQSDILELRSRESKVPVDNSLVVNSCHSAMREVEVLQDHLLSLFEKDPALSPADIIVMAPDIEVYSPLVQAVFRLERDHPHFIPFTLADGNAARGNELIDAFFALLDLVGGRFEASKIIDFVKRSVFRQKFAIQEADCQFLEQWVEGVAIRWGKDSTTKKDLGLPDFNENTWQAGFDRLLLGYCMTGNDATFKGILPYDKMEAGETELLGRFLESMQTLFNWLDNLPVKRHLTDWAEDLQALVAECFLAEHDNDNEAHILVQTLQKLKDIQLETGFSEKIGLEVIRTFLRQLLTDEHSPHGFLSGGVTFCSLLPMRAIPFKIICLLGMNDGAYPRPHFTLSFDLMSRSSRVGDRSPRHDDRYLFLEALLSARKQLYISYEGQSLRDDTTLPPSVLVSELLDYLGHGDAIVTRHRLQPFHPGYFQKKSGLVSYSQENFHAAQRLVMGVEQGAGFWHGLPLDEPDLAWRRVELIDFLDFFVHPVRFFCRKRLGVDLTAGREKVDDNEPFMLEGLGRYELERQLLEQEGHQEKLKDIAGNWKAAGLLPHGVIGQIAALELQEEVEALQRQLKPHLAPLVEPLIVDLELSDFRLSGRLEKVTENGLLFARPARIKGKDILRAWLQHLILNTIATDVPQRSVVIGKDGVVELQTVEDAGTILENLLGFYWQGLKEPLPFFAETSYNFVLHCLKGDVEKARQKAMESWLGGFNKTSEYEDAYLKFRYQDEKEALGKAFEEVSLQIFTPVFDHMETIALT